MNITELSNPTASIDLSFGHYPGDRQKQFSEHWINGTPDYCFSLDKKMRQKLASSKMYEAMARAASAFTVMLQKQLCALQAIAVGPAQYPNVHAIGVECARRLGIGVPRIYILFDPTPNAFTFASNDQGDVVVIHSCLVERYSEEELLFVIGHECGHIHNLHAMYRGLIEMMSNGALKTVMKMVPGFAQLVALASMPWSFFLKAWGRCQELTSDRAGLICCGSLEIAMAATAKLATAGGPLGDQINVEAFTRQLEGIQSTPVRLMEFMQSHPIIPKRLEALRLFHKCETLYRWRPEMRKDQAVIPLQEVDAKCEEFIRVLSKGYKGFDQ